MTFNTCLVNCDRSSFGQKSTEAPISICFVRKHVAKHLRHPQKIRDALGIMLEFQSAHYMSSEETILPLSNGFFQVGTAVVHRIQAQEFEENKLHSVEIFSL